MGEVFDFSVKTNSLSRAALSEDEGDIFNIHYGDILVKYNEVVDPIYDRVPKIRDGTTINLMEAVLKDGYVVFADAAEDLMVGKVVEVTNVTNNPTVAGLHTIVARPQIKFSDYYLGYYFNSHYFHKRIKYVAQGTKVFSISKHVLEQLMMEFPKKIEEQKAIVKLLGGLSRDITVQQRKSVSKDEVMNLFLFKSNALVDVDVYANSWEQRRLGEIFIETSEYVDPEKEALELWSLTAAGGLMPKIERYERGFLVKKNDKFKLLDIGNIAYNPMNITLGSIDLYRGEEPIAVSGYYVTMKISSEYDKTFISTWMKTEEAIKKYKIYATGSLIERQRVQYPTLAEIRMEVPAYNEQQQIGQFFEQLDHYITFQQRM